VLRTQMDAGPAKMRRRFTAAPEIVELAMRMTGEQLVTFREFVDTTIEAGALPFEWKDHRTGDPAEYRLLTEPEVAPLAPRDNGLEYWTVSMQVELLPAVSTVTAPATGGGGGSRSNFASGFGTMDGGGLESPSVADLGGAFNHEWVPGSIDQGFPGGPDPLGPAGMGPTCAGTFDTSMGCA